MDEQEEEANRRNDRRRRERNKGREIVNLNEGKERRKLKECSK